MTVFSRPHAYSLQILDFLYESGLIASSLRGLDIEDCQWDFEDS